MIHVIIIYNQHNSHIGTALYSRARNANFRCLSRLNESMSLLIGYEPAGLTAHLTPPPQNDRGCVNFFRIGV